jgi:hypothetical protein
MKLSDDVIAAIGTATDAEIGERFSINVAIISGYRRRHGIAPFRKHRMLRNPEKHEAIIKRLGECSNNATLAKEFGLSRERIRQIRNQVMPTTEVTHGNTEN